MSVFEGREIGERIKQARNEKGLRQEDLADLINVSTRTIQGYEMGETSQYRRLKAISEVLGKPVEWFLHGDQEEAARTLPPETLDALLKASETNRLLLEQVLRQLATLESELRSAEAPPAASPEPA